MEQLKVGATAILFTLSIMVSGAPAWADAAADIRALEERFVAAFKAKDPDAIMKVYAPGQTLLVFDVVPPRQYVGAAAYRKDWQTFFGSFDGPITVELLDLTVRVTDVYKKAQGRWLVIHEHVSVPVDLETGKPDLASKP